MNIQRIGEAPVNFDVASDEEIVRINTYAHRHLTKALGEVAACNTAMHKRKLFGIRRETPEFGNPMTSFEHDPFADFPEEAA